MIPQDHASYGGRKGDPTRSCGTAAISPLDRGQHIAVYTRQNTLLNFFREILDLLAQR